MKIAMLLGEGATASSVTMTLDMFCLAQHYQPEISWRPHLFSTHGGIIRLTDAVAVETQKLVANLGDYDAIILPGFFAKSLDHIATQLQTTLRAVIDKLQNLPETTLVAASCHGTFVLAEAGLLNGLPATTTWWLANEFQQRYPQIRLDADRALIDCGHVITAGAMTAHTNLSLHVLRRLGGMALARNVSSIMLVDGARSSQRPFMSAQKNFSDPLILRAIKWMTDNLTQPVSIDELANSMHISYRTLNHRFIEIAGLSPLSYLQTLKIEYAKEMLECTHNDFEAITASVGYEDVSSFRRLFKRLTGLTPAQYKRQFKAPYRHH